MVWSPSKDASPLTTMTGVKMPAAGQEEEACRNCTLLNRYHQQGPVQDWQLGRASEEQEAVAIYRPPVTPAGQLIGPYLMLMLML